MICAMICLHYIFTIEHDYEPELDQGMLRVRLVDVVLVFPVLMTVPWKQSGFTLTTLVLLRGICRAKNRLVAFSSFFLSFFAFPLECETKN